MASDLKRKADSKEGTSPRKKRMINPKNIPDSTLSFSISTQLGVPKRISTEGPGRKSIAAAEKIAPKKKKTTAPCAAKSNSIGVASGSRITNISARANNDPATSSISSGDRNGGRIGEISARAKRPISSGGRNGIAARLKINPRAMVKHGIKEDLVKKAVNAVLRTMLSRPRSNPVQHHRRMNFKPTKSRFHPDFRSTPPSTSVVAAKSGNEDLIRGAVSWLIKARLSTPTCSRTPIRTLGSGCLFTTSQSVITSS